MPPSPEQIAAAGVVKLADLLAAEAGEHDHHDHEPERPESSDVVNEIGGRRDGPDPTRYGDWEKNGRCIDF